MGTLTIDYRFNGFANIALGGYVGGILAGGRRRAEVTLRRPVKLGSTYQIVAGSDNSETLRDGNVVLAEVREASLDDVKPPEPVRLEESIAASRDFVGHKRHFFPTCFVCGPLRQQGDGLRIFPGSLKGRRVVAAPWTPSEPLAGSSGAVKSEFIWSALDCPTIWALVLHGQPNSKDKAVTARLAVEELSPVEAGQTHVVTGWIMSEIGRIRVAGGAIYSADGRLLSKARHTLVTTDWGVPLGLETWLSPTKRRLS